MVSTAGFIFPHTYSRKVSGLFSSLFDDQYNGNGEAETLPIKDEISVIIENVRKLSGSGSTALDPTLLVENAHILAKGKLYEEVMEAKISAATKETDIRGLEWVDARLRSFVLAERKARARLKVNYILAGAKSGRLEQAIQLLVER